MLILCYTYISIKYPISETSTLFLICQQYRHHFGKFIYNKTKGEQLYTVLQEQLYPVLCTLYCRNSSTPPMCILHCTYGNNTMESTP